MGKGKKSLFWASLLILPLIFGSIPKVNAQPSITFSAGIITVSGFTEETPCTFWDLWNASNVNGWNVVWNNRENDTQYQFDCRVRFVNGYFIDTSKQITFSDVAVTDNSQWLIELRTDAVFRGGELIDEANKICRHGLEFIALDIHVWTKFFELWKGATLQLYGCSFENPTVKRKDIWVNTELGSGTATFTLYSCMLSGNILLSGFGHTWNIHRLTDIGSNQSLEYGLMISGVLDDVLVAQKYYAVRVQQGYDITLKNLLLKKNTYAFFVYIISTDKYIINSDIDNWNFYYYPEPASTANVLRQYEFDLTLSYRNGTSINGTETGARVVIQHYGENAGVDYNATLGEDGKIPMQTLTKGFYNQTGGNTPYNVEPYNLHVYNISGYDEYNQNFTISQKTAWEIVLTPKRGFASGLGVGFVFAVMVALIFGLGLMAWKRK